MKIGILSMQRVDNYGSFLQALGLKKEIERQGHEVIFVDFKIQHSISYVWWKDVYGISPIWWRNTILFRIIKMIVRPVNVEVLYPQTNNTSKYFNVLGMDNHWHYRTKVDVLVIGSDEVFNYIQTNKTIGFSPELLGANNQAKKLISYAASCGNLTIEKLKQYKKVKLTSKLLKQFDVISVRDKNTGVMVSMLTGIQPEYHLDPVLVAEFGDIFTDNVDIRNYIIVYGYPDRFSDVEGERIRELAAKRHKKLIAFGGKQKFCDKFVVCSPLEILAYFKHADCIITDTFHGTIFSILNHKQFLSVVRTDQNVGYGNENKLGDLLERLELQDRRLQSWDSLTEEMDKFINYNKVDEIRLHERQRTRDYLKNNLKMIKEMD